MSETPKRELRIKRPSVRPLNEWVEMFVLSLGLGTLDMAKSEARTKVSKHAEHYMRLLLQHSAFSLTCGAERGIKQTLAFMLDPEHGEHVKKRRKDKAEKRKAVAHKAKVEQLFTDERSMGKLQ